MNNNLKIIPEQIKQVYQSPDFKEYDLPCAITMFAIMTFSEYTSIRSSLKQRKIKTIREALVHAINIASIIYNLCMLFHFTKHREPLNLFFLITAVFNITIQHRYRQTLPKHKNEKHINQTTFEEKSIQTSNDESQQNKIKELENEKEKLQQITNQHEKDKQELIKKHEIEISKKEEEIQKLKDELNNEEEKYNEQNERYMALLEEKNILTDQTGEIERLKEENEKMKNELSTMKEEIQKQAQNEIEKMTSKHAEEIEKNRKEIGKLTLKNTINQTRIQTQQKELTAAQNTNKTLEKTIKELKLSLTKQEKRILSQNTGLRELLDAKKKLTEKLAEKEKEKEGEKNNKSNFEHRKEVRTIQEENENLNLKIKEKEQKITDLEMITGQKQKKINKQDEEIQELRVLVGKLKTKAQNKNILTTSTYEDITRLNVEEEDEEENNQNFDLLTQSHDRYPNSRIYEQSNTPVVQRTRTKRSTSAPASPNKNLFTQ